MVDEHIDSANTELKQINDDKEETSDRISKLKNKLKELDSK